MAEPRKTRKSLRCLGESRLADRMINFVGGYCAPEQSGDQRGDADKFLHGFSLVKVCLSMLNKDEKFDCSNPKYIPSGDFNANGTYDHTMHSFRVPASGPIFLVLADNQCGSGCDKLVYDLGTFSQVLLAGWSTAGVMGYAVPGTFFLPRTKVRVNLSMWKWTSFKDGRSLEGYGFFPDMLLTSEKEHSADSILNLAHSLVEQQKFKVPSVKPLDW